MKKRIYILFISLLFPLIGVSQKDSSTKIWDIIAGGGVGIPQGSFSNSTHASNGPAVFISATEKVKNSIYDLVFMTSYNSNNYNLGASLNNPNPIMGTGYEDISIYGSYQKFCALVGLAINLAKKSPDFAFNIRFMTGAVYSYSPRETYYAINYNTPIPTKDFVSINSSSTVAIPLDFGVDLKINLHKNVFLFLGIDYLLSSLINCTGGIGYQL
jgi:hypothetical protein